MTFNINRYQAIESQMFVTKNEYVKMENCNNTIKNTKGNCLLR